MDTKTVNKCLRKLEIIGINTTSLYEVHYIREALEDEIRKNANMGWIKGTAAAKKHGDFMRSYWKKKKREGGKNDGNNKNNNRKR